MLKLLLWNEVSFDLEFVQQRDGTRLQPGAKKQSEQKPFQQLSWRVKNC
jgi:hypothetical protein